MTALGFILMVVGASVSLCLIMAIAWVIQQRTGNSGWVDTIWTFGLGLVGVTGALVPSGVALTSRQILVAGLVLVWALRLGVHVAFRTSGIKDDPRYANLQRGWGADASRQMFWLLQKQAWVSIPLAASMILAARNPIPGLRLQDLAATLALVIGIGGEALADHQLRMFRSRPGTTGRICDEGLWNWSRHPNYFFEWFGWLAYPLFAIAFGADYPWGFLALSGPACMYWVLVYVSGIPPLEQHMMRRNADAFRDYQSRVSAFFPNPPHTR